MDYEKVMENLKTLRVSLSELFGGRDGTREVSAGGDPPEEISPGDKPTK